MGARYYPGIVWLNITSFGVKSLVERFRWRRSYLFTFLACYYVVAEIWKWNSEMLENGNSEICWILYFVLFCMNICIFFNKFKFSNGKNSIFLKLIELCFCVIFPQRARKTRFYFFLLDPSNIWRLDCWNLP